MNERISIDTPDGSFSAYVALPAATPAPSIVVLQEIFGINADLRETCERLAAQGYIAVCPDLFWRLEPHVELTDKTDAEWKKAMALYKAFNVDKGVDDIAATLAAARALPGATGKAGVMGFCMGGLLTFLTATRARPDCAVAYYGGGTEKHIDAFKSLACPLMMHLGEADEYISAGARASIVKAAEGNPLVQMFTYPGQNHAFARWNGVHFDAQAATQANDRTRVFFAQHLKQATRTA
ncbi:dienelactone hydrolase family protein [Massilia sp. DJPM01]|uniref:dienelactone hydrolase family protein n=1 Tax=Massilia sp. DJPM01 TaxID=3024404 RepID=UPI00259D590D|nr:dienelactone hydrolase family protein [Massilia sp. DJPM01]MDM5177481.1 dienelactone hydrolase family protein [Massilia sp. DJPM01]